MKLTNLYIARIGWGKELNKLTGEITFDNQQAKVTLKLSEEKANQILQIVAQGVVEAAHEVAGILTTNVLSIDPEEQNLLD